MRYVADIDKSGNEYLSRADNADLSTGNIDFSACLWFRPLRTSANNQDLIGKWKAAANLEYLVHYVASAATDYVQFYVSANGSVAAFVESSVEIVQGSWNFIYVQHEAGVNISIGIDGGGLAAKAPAHVTGVRDGTAAFVLGGRDPYQNIYGADGQMASVGFWKRLLTAGERASMYNAGVPKLYSQVSGPERVSLISYWELGEESGERVDSHGSNNLTDNNSVGSALVSFGIPSASFSPSASASPSVSPSASASPSVSSSPSPSPSPEPDIVTATLKISRTKTFPSVEL